jgi:pimeloyl-ACP methyl ester carboxylesterase
MNLGAHVVRDAVRLHYLRSGGGQPALVLLHGLSANAQFFGGLLGVGLADHHDVIRVDLRGRGLSDKPATGYSMAEHAADVLAILDAARIDDAVLCGHSFGGMLAMWLAAHHPGRVRRQVLLDIAAPMISDPEVIQLIQPSLARLDREVASLDEYLASARGLPFLDGAWCDELDEFYRADVEPAAGGRVRPRSPRAVIEQCIQRGAEEDWNVVVARARAPALVVRASAGLGPPGTRPLVRAEDAHALVARLPDARYVEVPGNHFTMMFGPGARAVVTAIREFVRAAG